MAEHTMPEHAMHHRHGCFDWFRNLSRSKKAIVVVMSLWAVQAVPKWTVAITADGELSAQIMKVLVAPRVQ